MIPRLLCWGVFSTGLWESTLCILDWTTWLFQGFTEHQVLLLLEYLSCYIATALHRSSSEARLEARLLSAQVGAHKYLLIVLSKARRSSQQKEKQMYFVICTLSQNSQRTKLQRYASHCPKEQRGNPRAPVWSQSLELQWSWKQVVRVANPGQCKSSMRAEGVCRL